jgi:hypothetical protein
VRNGADLCALYDAILSPGPAASAPAGFLSVLAARSGDLKIGLGPYMHSPRRDIAGCGGAAFADLAARWLCWISRPVRAPPSAVHAKAAGAQTETVIETTLETTLETETRVETRVEMRTETEAGGARAAQPARPRWPRECLLLMCSLPGWRTPPAYPPTGAPLGAVNLKAGLDEGISSFCPPILFYMENPYRDNK